MNRAFAMVTYYAFAVTVKSKNKFQFIFALQSKLINHIFCIYLNIPMHTQRNQGYWHPENGALYHGINLKDSGFVPKMIQLRTRKTSYQYLLPEGISSLFVQVKIIYYQKVKSWSLVLPTLLREVLMFYQHYLREKGKRNMDVFRKKKKKHSKSNV